MCSARRLAWIAFTTCGAALSSHAHGQTFSSTPNLTIADNTTVSDTITVAGGPQILSALTVRINVTHTWDSDVDIALVHNGQYILLTTDNGSSGDNYTNTVFSDAAATLINTGTPPFTGTFRPEGGTAAANGWSGSPNPPAATANNTLGAWNNQDGNGAWQLLISDSVGSDTGVLLDWSVTLDGVGGLPTNPQGVGTASATAETGSTVMTVVVTPGLNPPSTGLTVRGNLTGVGGSATQVFFNDGTHGDATSGDNTWSYTHALPPTVVTGSYNVPFTVSDAENRSSTGSMSLDVSNGPRGACCASSCSITRHTLCVQAGGTFLGAGSNCGTRYDYSQNSSPFIDISQTGTRLETVSACDDCTETITLPFQFRHLGSVYSSANVSSNGNIQFTTNSAAYTNVPIPNAAIPNDMLAPLWDDYDLNDTRTGPGLGAVYVKNDIPNLRFIISWQGVGQYNAGFPVADSNDFQIILYQNNNAEFRYGNVPTILSPRTAGDTVTIGFENFDGTEGLEFPSASVGAGNTTVSLTATVVSPCVAQCDPVDFNGDTLFPDTQDITDFITVFGGGACPTGTCGDIDFNNDGLFPDTDDISALIRVFGGGACTP